MDGTRIGRSVRALRQRHGWRQVDLARRAWVSQSEVSRIELGHVDGIVASKLERVVGAVGGSLDMRVRWNGEGLDRLLDAAHAATVDATMRMLTRYRWDAVPEVTFAIRGERGSIDVLARHPASGTVLVIEVKSAIPDMQSMLASLDRKVRLGPIIARERGFARTGSVSRLLVVSESATNRRRVETHAAILTATFPIRGRLAAAWLRDPGAGQTAMAGLIFLSSTNSAGVRRRGRVRPGRGKDEARSDRRGGPPHPR